MVINGDTGTPRRIAKDEDDAADGDGDGDVEDGDDILNGITVILIDIIIVKEKSPLYLYTARPSRVGEGVSEGTGLSEARTSEQEKGSKGGLHMASPPSQTVRDPNCQSSGPFPFPLSHWAITGTTIDH